MTAVNLRAGKSDKRRNSRSNGDVIHIPAHLCGSSTRECHLYLRNFATTLYRIWRSTKATSFQWSCQGTICCPVKTASCDKQPGLIAQTAITAARIAAGSAVGHTTGAAISVDGGYSDTAPASQAEQMHHNVDSKEPDEQILATSLQSEGESHSTQCHNQTTTTTSVPTLNRSNTFTCSYSKKSEEGSSANPTKERQSSTRPQKMLSKQCASDETKQTSHHPTTS